MDRGSSSRNGFRPRRSEEQSREGRDETILIEHQHFLGQYQGKTFCLGQQPRELGICHTMTNFHFTVAKTIKVHAHSVI